MESRDKYAGATATLTALLFMAFALGVPVLGLSQPGVAPPSGTATAEPSADVRELAKRSPIERALAPGEVHSYRLNLSAEDAVSIQFERQGVPLMGAVLDPGGGKVARFGSSMSRTGLERVDFTAKVPGTYRIELRTYLPPDPPGRYKVTLTEQVKTAPDRPKGPAISACVEKSWVDHLNRFDVDSALGSIAGCMETVAGRLVNEFPEAAGLASDAQSEAEFLMGRWHWGEAVSPAYETSLILDFRMLAIAAKESDRKKARAILEDVAEDVKIKAEHCRNSERGLGQDVKVQVTTKKGNEEVKGWIVYYMPRIYEYLDTHKPERFPKESSPTIQDLPAGKYLMWAGRSDYAAPPSVQRQIVKVGEGNTNRSWDLSVP